MKKGSIKSLVLSAAVAAFLVIAPSVFAQEANISAQPLPSAAPVQQSSSQQTTAPSLQQMTPRQAEAYQQLTPAQRGAVEAELGKSGGRLTPEALEALRARPEFKGLTPEDVARGKQLLDQRERSAERMPAADEGGKTVIEEARERSLFDRTRRIGKYQDISLALRPFGYDFFGEAAVRVLTERKDVPIPLKYVIGPGDEVKLLLWGRVNAQYSLTVDRDGKITIPQIGPLFVAGMTFEEMSKQVVKQAEQIVGTNVDVAMGSLKTIPVFILGDVRRPGSYTIGSFATITDALLLAGGPTEIGSMRNVQLKRKNRLVATFDLYDLLLKGDKSKDMTLMEGDVVFVPVTGPLVGVAGNVKRPAIYELRDHRDLESLLELAGGIIPTAYTQQIQVERILRNERQIVFDIDDKHLERAGTIALQDADLVKIFNIVDMNVNVVYLNGNVKRPGKYEIKPGMKLGDVLKSVNDFLPETYFDYVLIKRLKPPGMETVLIPVNLGNWFFRGEETGNVDLNPQDQVFVFNKWFFREKPFVIVEGEVRGDYSTRGGLAETTTGPAVSKRGGTLSPSDVAAVGADLKAMETDLRKDGLFDLANVLRSIGEEIRTHERVPVEKLGSIKDELLRRNRQDMAARILDMEHKAWTRCEIALVDNMRLKDAILIAGGLTNDSYLEKGEILRTNKKREYRTIYFNVARAMAGDAEHNLALQNEDRVIIHSVWEHVPRRTVSVAGEVSKPGAYQLTENMTVRELIFSAGNFLQSTHLDEAELTSMVVEEGKGVRYDTKIINLKKALEGDESHNVKLKPYDRLLVRRITDWRKDEFVTLSGEFKFPGRYAIRKGETLSSVISRAGGYTDNAYLRGAVFTRLRTRQLQQDSLQEMALRLERELLAQGSAAISSSLSADEVRAREVEMVQKKKFIETLKDLKATGRMSIRMAPIRLLKGSHFDIGLEEGDQIFIPQKNNVVNIVGAVMSQTSFIYVDKLTHKDYVNMAGGYARYADVDRVFVMKVDGSARKLNDGFVFWNDSRDRWELTALGREAKDIEPGDTIVVPEKLEKIAWLREIRDITQIVMNIAMTAGILIKVF